MRDGATNGRHRAAPRLATHLAGSLTGKRRVDVQVLDLSLTGCLVRCPASLDRGLIMDLTLQIEGGEFSAKVQVADSSQDGQAGSEGVLYLVGLAFLALPLEGEHLLRRFFQQERSKRLRSGA